eukprot:4570911-Pleurochrysis_carterae.AAC.1
MRTQTCLCAYDEALVLARIRARAGQSVVHTCAHEGWYADMPRGARGARAHQRSKSEAVSSAPKPETRRKLRASANEGWS